MKIKEDINSVNVASLQPPLDEDSLIKELISQFLAHDGYVETAKAFAGEVRSEANALRSGSNTTLNTFEIEDDLDAVNRQRMDYKFYYWIDLLNANEWIEIRAAILDGDIDKALKRINAYYPDVLRNNHKINFRIRCRKFIEMMRQTAELRKASTERRPKGMTSHSNDIFEQAMELDDRMSNNDDWDRMDTEEADNDLKFEDKMKETVLYGQDLKYEFKDKQNKEVKDFLQEMFAMFAYEDIWKSPTAHLLEQSGRVVVAEELNSAILGLFLPCSLSKLVRRLMRAVSLGKSSSAAIELLCQQTEVLVSDISEEGGAGAFINVHNDFLR